MFGSLTNERDKISMEQGWGWSAEDQRGRHGQEWWCVIKIWRWRMGDGGWLWHCGGTRPGVYSWSLSVGRGWIGHGMCQSGLSPKGLFQSVGWTSSSPCMFEGTRQSVWVAHIDWHMLGNSPWIGETAACSPFLPQENKIVWVNFCWDISIVEQNIFSVWWWAASFWKLVVSIWHGYVTHTNGSLENDSSKSGFSRAAIRACSSLIVSSFVTLFRHFTVLIPAFCFAAVVITGAAGWADWFLGWVSEPTSPTGLLNRCYVMIFQVLFVSMICYYFDHF